MSKTTSTSALNRIYEEKWFILLYIGIVALHYLFLKSILHNTNTRPFDELHWFVRYLVVGSISTFAIFLFGIKESNKFYSQKTIE